MGLAGGVSFYRIHRPGLARAVETDFAAPGCESATRAQRRNQHPALEGSAFVEFYLRLCVGRAADGIRSVSNGELSGAGAGRIAGLHRHGVMDTTGGLGSRLLFLGLDA